MKKILISSLLLATFLTPTLAIHAQTVEENVATLQAQVSKLMELIRLLELVESLKAQIATLSAQQSQTSQAVADVSNKVDTVVANQTSAPVFGNTAPTIPPVTAVVIGNPVCGESNPQGVSFPVTINGDDWSSISFGYMDFGHTSTMGNISTTTVSQGQINPTRTGFSRSDKGTYLIHGTPSFGILNIPASYDMTPVVTNMNGKMQSYPTQKITVPESCRTDLAKELLPVN